MKRATVRRAGLVLVSAVLLAGGAAGVTWGVRQFLDTFSAEPGKQIPTTTVRKGRVVITISARGELQGGSSEMLTVPPTGATEVPITMLRSTGEVVQAGDVVAELDTTQQEYNLREAQADLAEAEQKVMQAQAEAAASLEEARYAMLSAAADLQSAEWEARKNPLLAANVARQNDISVAAARNRKEQAERDYKNRQAGSEANVALQRTNQNKFKMLADNAQRMIDGMVLKAKTAGYVHVMGNQNGQLLYTGATVPDFQAGDTARTGQTIAQIPDMSSWEVNASVPELDRGYMAVGQKAEIGAAVLGGRVLNGHIKALGGTTGVAASRRFECRVALDQTDPALRPGMTTNIVITVAEMDNVLWVPSQAVFDSENRSYVYVSGPAGFIQQDIQLIRRGESQTVIAGLPEGTRVALSRPDQQSSSDTTTGSSALKALPK
jgi:HlyD family secretion protein